MSEDELKVPDDLSGLDDEVPSVAMVLTPVAGAEPLAAACAVAGVDVDVVPSDVGAIAVLRNPSAGAAAAEAVSRLLRAVPVVLLERRPAQASASRWVGGERVGDLPPGLVLADGPAVLEDLLLGSIAPADAAGVVASGGLSRWRALRILSRGRKAPRPPR